MEKAINEPQGIAGWLIFPALGLIITPFRMGFQFYKDLLPNLTPQIWNAVTNPASSVYHPLWGPLIIFEVTANLVQFIFTLWVMWVFFKKSNKTPRFFIIWLIMLASVQIIDMLLVKQIPMAAAQSVSSEIIKDIARPIIGAIIWIPYFLVSKRVKNTFTESAP
jgi:hypothetical protein